MKNEILQSGNLYLKLTKKSPNEAYPLDKLNVLYVEDDEMIRSNLVPCFENIFNSTEVAFNGQMGLEKYKESLDKNKPFDLIITDVNMPYLNGIDMMREIKLLNPEVPCVITTAFTDSRSLLESLNIGINNFAIKPFKMIRLLDEIEKAYTPVYYKSLLDIKNEKIEELERLVN